MADLSVLELDPSCHSFYPHPKEQYRGFRFLEMGLARSWFLATDVSSPRFSQFLLNKLAHSPVTPTFEARPQQDAPQHEENIGSVPATRLAGREECGSQR